MQQRLSALTDSVVDSLFNIDAAKVHDNPTFLFLVGVPGSGKSSGHARAIDAGIIEAGNYATINLDTLVESILPFRAGSSMAHLLRRNPTTRDLVHFGSISAYGSHRENLGAFKWYDDAHNALAAAEPNTVTALNRVRAAFATDEVQQSILDVGEAAMHRAIEKRVNIVFETTLSLTRGGRVNKVDALMEILDAYHVYLYHVHGASANIATRLRRRQEYGMPYEEIPFYRYVPASEDFVRKQLTGMHKAVRALEGQYAGRITFDTYENVMDESRLPPTREFNFEGQRNRIVRAFGPQTRRRSSQRKSSTNSGYLANTEGRKSTRRKTK